MLQLHLLMQHICDSQKQGNVCAIMDFPESLFIFLISKLFAVFYSKHKPGNAFVVARVEGK